MRSHARALARGTLLSALALFGARAAAACDLCSIYTATVMQEHKTGPWAAVSEQFTSFNTLRDGDDEIPNDNAEWLQSSITQLVVGWSFHQRFGLQVNIPLIAREFRRFHDGAIEHGDENGLGDISVVGRLNLVEHVTGRTLARWDLLGGFKLPTGDSDRLEEELEHDDEVEGETQGTPSSPVAAARQRDGNTSKRAGGVIAGGARDHHVGHGDEELSGVHGHDLALGTGSFDFIIGTTAYLNWRRAFFEASLQYIVRGNGDHSYDFANDLLWSAGPGAFAWLGHEGTVAIEAAFNGEAKGKDTQLDETADDTAITALYLGPRVIGTFTDKLNADVGVEWPLFQEVSAVQLVPDWRVRTGLTWRF